MLPRFLRPVRRLPVWLLVTLTAPFLLEVLLHQWRYSVPRPASKLDEPFFTSCQEPDVSAERANAVLVMLARNSEREKAKKSIRSIEKYFNQWFEYPIVFLNDQPWDARFVQELNATANGRASFEVIPPEQWTFPDWIDVDAAKQSIKNQGRKDVPHAGDEGYHHMCRFYSGNFYELDVLKDYKWYWRIEPDVEYTCAITYDPFVQMARHKKVYGFTIALWEIGKSCPGLFRSVADWKRLAGISTNDGWKAMISASWVPLPFRRFLSFLPYRDAYGDEWSLCHYWSNFEIADLDFFRTHAYKDLIQYLDKQGGFYFERWGDAAVHSLAVAMLLEPSQIHHFEDFGYRHGTFYQCPANAPKGQLSDSPILGKDTTSSPGIEGGIGCRCECDGRKTRNFRTICTDRLKQSTTPKGSWRS